MSNFETSAIRIQSKTTENKEHSVPVFLTSSFIFESAEEGEALFANRKEGNIYSRFSNPNVDEFADKITRLEGGEAGLATATGMGAVFVSLAALLKKGDHIVASRSLFGNTLHILNHILPDWGITTTYADISDNISWEKAFQPETKWVLVETPSNPTLDIIDIEWLAKLTKSRNASLMVDNCFCTPYLQQPLKWGADLVIHSATKWIDGQGRVLGGAIIGGEKHVGLCYDFIRRTGISLSPFNAWILSKSLETLHVRMDRHCENAMAVAKFLESHPKIEKVLYPFLPSHPQYETAKKQMKKGGGIVSAVLKSNQKEDGLLLLNQLKMFSLTANLGDTRSIATHPSSTTHSKLSKVEQKEVGITPGLIRFSIGLEHIEDIITDLQQALEKI